MTRLDFAGVGASLEPNPEGRFVTYEEADARLQFAISRAYVMERKDEECRAATILLQDAGMLIRRLCRRLPVDDKVRTGAEDWLRQKGIQGQILRDEDKP